MRGVILVGMKRNLTIAGIFLAFILAAVVVVLATRQDISQAPPASSMRVTQSGNLKLEPHGQPRMTVVAQLPTTNFNGATR